MPRLLSGSTLRRGGSGEFIDLKGAMPQLPPTETTATGFTLVTDSLLRTSYRSSLGFIEFKTATMYSSLPEGTIRILATGSTFLSNNTYTGNLVVQGGIGVGGNMHIEEDIVVNRLTIGRGYEGLNNIVIRGNAQPQLDDFNDGKASIAIGDDALLGITTSYRNIAIGRYALHSGTNLSNNIALGDSALKKIGFINALPVANISAISNTDPVVVTANNHGLNSGTYITFTGVGGTVELNGQNFYMQKLSDNTLSLYTDNILSNSVDGTTYGVYTSGGTVDRILLKNNNIAIGNDSGQNLFDGEKNFFIGDGVGKNLTTGSYNFFVGHQVGDNITQGNYNIALGGDNLVDGLDNQVNIGSVFYYNGLGDLQLNADTETGLGSTATVTPPGLITNTSTYTGGLVVIGGLVVTENAIINKDVKIFSTTPATSATTGALVVGGGIGIGQNLYVGFDANIGSSLTAIGSGNVTLSPNGGNVNIEPELGGTVIIAPSLVSGSMDNIDIGINTPRFGKFIEITATVKTTVLGTETAISTTTGALVVKGGIGVGGGIFVGDQSTIQNSNNLEYPSVTPALIVRNTGSNTSALSLRNNSGDDINFVNNNGELILVNSAGEFLLTDGTSVKFPGLTTVTNITNAISTDTGALVVYGGVGIGKDLWVGGNIYGPAADKITASATGVYVNTATTSSFYIGLTKFIGTTSQIFSTSTFVFNGDTETLEIPKINVISSLSSTVTNTEQSLVVNGGAFINKGIYSVVSGNSQENNLVYTPIVTVSTTTPLNPKLGDFWIDPTYGVELQYIQDGANKIWIQFTGV